MPRCTACGWELAIEMFARDASKASGHKSHCKACDNEKSQAYYAANRERKLEYMRKRNAALREAGGWRGRRAGRESGAAWLLLRGAPGPKATRHHPAE